MARIAIVESSTPADLPSPVLRVDLAWALFWPGIPAGSLPAGGGDALMPWSRWLWESLGRVTGFLRPAPPDTVWVSAPPCQPAARELLTRLVSFWSTDVYWVPPDDVTHPQFSDYPNRWLPPVRDVHATPDPESVWEGLTVRGEQGEDRFLMPGLGVGRVYMKVQVVNPGTASVELHSHSTQDEHYLILSGHGTLRIASQRIPVGPGSLIAKPAGPDLTSQILADDNEPVVVLDIETFASHYGRKDVCVCPDENLVILQGSGWWSTLPLETMAPIG